MKRNLLISLILLISVFSCVDQSNKEAREANTEPTPSIAKTVESVISEEQLETKNNIECECFDGIGSSKGDKPILISKYSNGKSVITCGYFDEEIQESELIMSEFNIFDCNTGEVLVEYGAVQVCRIREKYDTLIIEELKYLPVGVNWNWELIQTGEQNISQQKQEYVVSELTPKLGKIQVDSAEQTEFLNSLKRGSGIGENWEEELGKLEVLALMGNSKAWEILENYEEFTGGQTDGASAEQWKDAVANVQWMN